MKNFLLEIVILCLIPMIIVFGVLIIYYRRHPLKDIPLPVRTETIVFYPACWPWLLIVCGFILSAGTFCIVFLIPPPKELLAWIGFSCLSLIFLAPTLGGTYQMLTARVILTSEYIEYRTLWTVKRITINQIENVRQVWSDLYLISGNNRIKIPLLFKNSREMVWLLQKSVKLRNPNSNKNQGMSYKELNLDDENFGI